MTKSGTKCLIRALLRSIQIPVAEFPNDLAKSYPTVKKYGQKKAQKFRRLSNNRYWSRNFQGPFSGKYYLILGYLITGFDCTLWRMLLEPCIFFKSYTKQSDTKKPILSELFRWEMCCPDFVFDGWWYSNSQASSLR